jgi:hypothetical protein
MVAPIFGNAVVAVPESVFPRATTQSEQSRMSPTQTTNLFFIFPPTVSNSTETEKIPTVTLFN